MRIVAIALIALLVVNTCEAGALSDWFKKLGADLKSKYIYFLQTHYLSDHHIPDVLSKDLWQPGGAYFFLKIAPSQLN